MSAISALFQNTQSKLDLGAAMLQGTQAGATLGQSFRAQEAAQLAQREVMRAENAAAFEMAVRAGKAIGDAADRELRNRVNTEGLQLRQQELEQRRLEFEQRKKEFGDSYGLDKDRYDLAEKEFDLEKEGIRRRNRIQDRVLNDMGYPSGDGGMDSTLFGGGDGGNNQFTFEGEMTTFSHLGDLRDPEDSGVGFNNNPTADVPGVSINQEMFEKAFPGVTDKDSIMNDFEVDIYTKSGKHLGTLPIVDRGPSNKIIADRGNVLDITAAGIDSLGGQLITRGNMIVGHGLTGPHKFVVRRKGASSGVAAGELDPNEELDRLARGDDAASMDPASREAAMSGALTSPPVSESEARVPNGTLPTDPVYDPDFIRDLSPKERIPFRQAAMEEQRQLLEAEELIEMEKKILESQKEILDTKIDSSLAFNKSIDINIADPRLIKERNAVAAQELQTFKNDLALQRERKRIEDNIAATNPAFKDFSAAAQEKVEQILRVNSGLDRVMKISRDEIADKDRGRIRGAITKFKNMVKENMSYSQLQAELDGLVPTLARGIFGEVGVLTDNDMRRYQEVLPKITDSATLAEALAQALRLQLADAAVKTIKANLNDTDVSALRETFIGEFGLEIIGTAGLKTPQAVERIEGELEEQARIQANDADPSTPKHGDPWYADIDGDGEDEHLIYNSNTGEWEVTVE